MCKAIDPRVSDQNNVQEDFVFFIPAKPEIYDFSFLNADQIKKLNSIYDN